MQHFWLSATAYMQLENDLLCNYNLNEAKKKSFEGKLRSQHLIVKRNNKENSKVYATIQETTETFVRMTPSFIFLKSRTMFMTIPIYPLEFEK